MKCPTADKLSQYVDEMLTEQERIEIKAHLKSCVECKNVVEAFVGEQLFIKETLQTPTLPDDFTSLVLDELEPYEQTANRQKRTPWKRISLSAAGIVLAVGLSATLNPAFAQWVGGLFSTNKVDEGLRMATEAGFANRVNQEVTDNGVTFKVEDVVADSSRVAFSYQILNENGKIKHKEFEFGEGKNEIIAMDQHGKRLELSSTSWSNADDYGLIELSLREHEDLENINLKFNLTVLNGKKGSWKLDIPVDLKESLKATKTLPLKDAKANQHGVNIDMKEVRYAPSSNEILYETSFTEEEQAKIENEIQQLEDQYGKEIVNSFTGYGTAIEYHIENEEMKAVYHRNAIGPPSESGMLQGVGQPKGKLGRMIWNESFIPQKDDQKLTFVLDGIIKTEPSDFSITFKPKELKKNPVSFEYEGNLMTIKEAKKHSKYSLRRSLFPIRKETTFKIEMEGSSDAQATVLQAWALVDDKGKAYLTYRSGGTSYDKDVKSTMTLISYDLDKVPEEITLHLISATRYYELQDKWKVPLY